MAKVRLPGRMQPSRLFLRPLSLKYTIPHSRFFKKNWLFKLKYDIFEEYFRNLLRFSQICRNFQNNIEPFPPRYLSHVWNELAALRTLKITENGPWLNKSGQPWSQSYKTSFEEKRHFFGVIYATFLRTNLSVEINAKINAKKGLLS
jgi:hypothetical protein